MCKLIKDDEWWYCGGSYFDSMRIDDDVIKVNALNQVRVKKLQLIIEMKIWGKYRWARYFLIYFPYTMLLRVCYMLKFMISVLLCDLDMNWVDLQLIGLCLNFALF